MRLMEIVCRCGWSIRGSERDVIAGIKAHARADHQLSMTARDIKAMWRLVDDAPAQGDASAN